MSALETVAQLRAGQRPASGLLHICRLHAFGGEAYGEEAIVERFRTMPYAVATGGDPLVVAVPGHLALFAGAGAMIADLSGENVSRLWRIGPGTPVLPEPGVSVVFDTDLAQARGDVFFAASDHPALAPDASGIVEEIGRDLARNDTGYRARAFAIRAFGNAREGAALFAVHRLSDEKVRSAAFIHVAARWDDAGVTIVRDTVGEAAATSTPWTPRVGA